MKNNILWIRVAVFGLLSMDQFTDNLASFSEGANVNRQVF